MIIYTIIFVLINSVSGKIEIEQLFFWFDIQNPPCRAAWNIDAHNFYWPENFDFQFQTSNVHTHTLILFSF